MIKRDGTHVHFGDHLYLCFFTLILVLINIKNFEATFENALLKLTIGSRTGNIYKVVHFYTSSNEN